MLNLLIDLLILIGIIYYLNKRRKRFPKFIEENKITVTKKSNRFQDGKIIVYDEDNNYLWIYLPIGKEHIGFSIDSLTGCELLVDKETQFRTSITSTAGRAIIGGMLFNGVGAIVGGITGKKKGRSLVHEMELLISTSNLDYPFVSIMAFKNKKGVKADSTLFKDKLNDARYWCKFTEAVIERQKAPTS